MKSILIVKSIVLVGLLFFVSCSGDEGANVGEGLLGTSKLDVNFAEEDIEITNGIDEKSDLSQNSIGLLGTLNDKVFGKTQGSFAFQVRLPSAISFEKPVIDSVKLFLAYKNHYGSDTLFDQKARVYLLNSALDYKGKYTASTDVTTLLGDEVGVLRFHKDLISDTIYLKSALDTSKDSVINSVKQVDTILNHLAVNLDNKKVGQYILDATDADLESSADFLNYFKGLYVTTDDIADTNTQGAIYGFDMYKSYLKLYYKNSRRLENGNDTLYSTRLLLPITDNSARFNYPVFTHPSNLLNDDNFVYLQGIHGTKAIVNVPNLNSWADSTNTNINKAVLEFKIATDTIQAKDYFLPRRINLVAVNKKGEKVNLRYTVGNILSGILNSNEDVYSYSLYITEYLQDIIDGDQTFDHFELYVGGVEFRSTYYPTDGKNTARRVVLYNSGKNKPTIKISYTNY